LPGDDSKCRQRRLNVAQWTPHSHSDWLSHRRPGLLTRQALRETVTLQHTFASGRGTDRRGGCCEKGFRKLCLAQILCNFHNFYVFGLQPDSLHKQGPDRHMRLNILCSVFACGCLDLGQDRITCSKDRDSDT
jgi:hypothetical protein